MQIPGAGPQDPDSGAWEHPVQKEYWPPSTPKRSCTLTMVFYRPWTVRLTQFRPGLNSPDSNRHHGPGQNQWQTPVLNSPGESPCITPGFPAAVVQEMFLFLK